MNDIKNCPICLKDYKEYPALSRRDNKTLICTACDQRQTIIDYNNKKLKDEQLMILESLNQSLVINYVWDNYTDDCIEKFKEHNYDNDHDDYSSDMD